MNAPEQLGDWSDANQRVLVAEFARIKQLLAGTDASVAYAEADAARAAMAQPAAIDQLGEIFGLSAFERDIVLLAAGAEMDGELAALCGQAQGQAQRPWPTFRLASALLPNPHWSAIAPLRPLRRWRLVDFDPAHGMAASRLALDERVAHFVAGLDYLDPRIEHMLRPLGTPSAMAPAHAQLCADLAAQLARHEPPLPVLQLTGPDRQGCEDIAATCASRLGLRLHALDASALAGPHADVAALATLCEREAALGASALLLDCGDDAPAAPILHFAERIRGVLFLVAARPLALRRPTLALQVDYPGRLEQRALWRDALGSDAAQRSAELDAVATQFCFSARTIAATAAALRLDGEGNALWDACRRIAPAGLADLGQRIEPAAGWDDLVLPPTQKEVLAQIAVHMRHRFAVYDDWGFGARGSRGLGIGALFAGESGTGKTMAAEVLARELRLELYRIDLSGVVSKYIGETEKNLRRVFDAAEGSGAMLLFDEADALFGKRSEVKDSHDRYANIEVSYLLQRMEAFRGLAILTTNHKAALDAAFMRRLRFVVQFPFPELAEREQIWRRAFPSAVPLGDIAWTKLARLQASGGQIHNIALAAAFLAADAGERVSMAHLLRAARSESAKRERPLADAETRGWV